MSEKFNIKCNEAFAERNIDTIQQSNENLKKLISDPQIFSKNTRNYNIRNSSNFNKSKIFDLVLIDNNSTFIDKKLKLEIIISKNFKISNISKANIINFTNISDFSNNLLNRLEKNTQENSVSIFKENLEKITSTNDICNYNGKYIYVKIFKKEHKKKTSLPKLNCINLINNEFLGIKSKNFKNLKRFKEIKEFPTINVPDKEKNINNLYQEALTQNSKGSLNKINKNNNESLDNTAKKMIVKINLNKNNNSDFIKIEKEKLNFSLIKKEPEKVFIPKNSDEDLKLKVEKNNKNFEDYLNSKITINDREKKIISTDGEKENKLNTSHIHNDIDIILSEEMKISKKFQRNRTNFLSNYNFSSNISCRSTSKDIIKLNYSTNNLNSIKIKNSKISVNKKSKNSLRLEINYNFDDKIKFVNKKEKNLRNFYNLDLDDENLNYRRKQGNNTEEEESVNEIPYLYTNESFYNKIKAKNKYFVENNKKISNKRLKTLSNPKNSNFSKTYYEKKLKILENKRNPTSIVKKIHKSNAELSENENYSNTAQDFKPSFHKIELNNPWLKFGIINNLNSKKNKTKNSFIFNNTNILNNLYNLEIKNENEENKTNENQENNKDTIKSNIFHMRNNSSVILDNSLIDNSNVKPLESNSKLFNHKNNPSISSYNHNKNNHFDNNSYINNLKNIFKQNKNSDEILKEDFLSENIQRTNQYIENNLNSNILINNNLNKTRFNKTYFTAVTNKIKNKTNFLNFQITNNTNKSILENSIGLTQEKFNPFISTKFSLNKIKSLENLLEINDNFKSNPKILLDKINRKSFENSIYSFSTLPLIKTNGKLFNSVNFTEKQKLNYTKRNDFKKNKLYSEQKYILNEIKRVRNLIHNFLTVNLDNLISNQYIDDRYKAFDMKIQNKKDYLSAKEFIFFNFLNNKTNEKIFVKKINRNDFKSLENNPKNLALEFFITENNSYNKEILEYNTIVENLIIKITKDINLLLNFMSGINHTQIGKMTIDNVFVNFYIINSENIFLDKTIVGILIEFISNIKEKKFYCEEFFRFKKLPNEDVKDFDIPNLLIHFEFLKRYLKLVLKISNGVMDEIKLSLQISNEDLNIILFAEINALRSKKNDMNFRLRIASIYFTLIKSLK